MPLWTDYDVWRGGLCGAEKTVPSRPHQQPKCCGTGMFWDRFTIGDQYRWPRREAPVEP